MVAIFARYLLNWPFLDSRESVVAFYFSTGCNRFAFFEDNLRLSRMIKSVITAPPVHSVFDLITLLNTSVADAPLSPSKALNRGMLLDA